jgi:signal transduction histidine kinase
MERTRGTPTMLSAAAETSGDVLADFPTPLSSVVEIARHLVKSRRASLMLPAGDPDQLQVAVASGLPAAVAAEARVRIGDPVSGLVAKNRQPLLVNEGRGVRVRRFTSHQTGSFISVPIPLEGAACGVLNVSDPVADATFDVDDLTALQSYAGQVANTLAFEAARQRLEQMQDAVRQSRLQLIQAQEDERRRIARDLHDEAGHTLTAAIFRLDLEAMKLPRDFVEAHATLDRTRASLLDCAATLHNIAFALRPQILEDLGLSAALRSLTAQAMELGIERVDLTIDGREPPLDEATELAVFRMVQEALTNIRKHARARRAWVQLVFDPDQALLAIEDDGVGVARAGAEDEATRRRPSLGLRGLRDRIEALGGAFEMGPRAEGGTRLAARLPLAPHHAERDGRDWGQDSGRPH